MNIAAIIVGIDNWQRYTLPLVESIQKHEPDCWIMVIDNDSKEQYPQFDMDNETCRVMVVQTERLCYSAAINWGKQLIGDADWTIVLSNDVLCTGPFARILAEYDDANVVGPQLWHEHGLSWIVGWCVAIPRTVWDAVGGWDEGYVMSSVEDVDFSHSARREGFGLVEDTRLPFVHLDQKQRFGLPGYAGSEAQNWQYFQRKHAKVTA